MEKASRTNAAADQGSGSNTTDRSSYSCARRRTLRSRDHARGRSEDMFTRKCRYLFRFLAEHEKLAAFERKTVIKHLNRELVWLKHDKRPNVLYIRRSVAVSMITRAASKLRNWTPPIEQFRAWLVANVDDIYR